MNIIICIDKSKGMMFNNRRQSQDAVLREKFMSICSNPIKLRTFINFFNSLLY